MTAQFSYGLKQKMTKNSMCDKCWHEIHNFWWLNHHVWWLSHHLWWLNHYCWWPCQQGFLHLRWEDAALPAPTCGVIADITTENWLVQQPWKSILLVCWCCCVFIILLRLLIINITVILLSLYYYHYYDIIIIIIIITTYDP